MGVPTEIAFLGQTEPDTLAIPLARPLEVGRLGGRIQELVASGEFRGDRGDALTLHATDNADHRIPAREATAGTDESQEGEIEIRQFFELDDFGPSDAVDRARELGKELEKSK